MRALDSCLFGLHISCVGEGGFGYSFLWVYLFFMGVSLLSWFFLFLGFWPVFSHLAISGCVSLVHIFTPFYPSVVSG